MHCSRAPPVPHLEPDESQASSLIDVDSPHVVSVKSDFEEQAIKTETQAERIEREQEAKAREAAAKHQSVRTWCSSQVNFSRKPAIV